MGNKCIAQSGEEYYKAINYQRYLNETDLNKKYQFKNKIFAKKDGIKTIKVFDMVFSKTRIMKQVLQYSALIRRSFGANAPAHALAGLVSKSSVSSPAFDFAGFESGAQVLLF